MAEFNLGFMGHGGDYNPDQWRHIPGTLQEDMRLMKLAGCNLMSVGIFSWAALEPEEGKYDFGWLREALDAMHENGVSAFLATPSGARPAWMDDKYPEVMRVRQDGMKFIHGVRHIYCFTSPAYRHLVSRMNARLAEEFGYHPAVVGWHISNEYHGECHCDACQAAFRTFLREKYGTLEHLNHAWWTGFWAKTYTDWNQIHSPGELGETAVNGLIVDWQRFVTHQTLDFMREEIRPIRTVCPDLPVTTNMHGLFPVDYFKFKGDIDFASYDAYPTWDSVPDAETADLTSFHYDYIRAIKGAPWALMESTPSMTNWQEVCRPKRPGMHMLSSMQAVAHGADTVQYFQWRKSRGACEKLHGAVVGHDGTEHTRVFRDVAEVGDRLKKLAPVVGTQTRAKAAVIFDQENRWAVNAAQGPRRDKQYEKTVMEHYSALKSLGIDVDVIDEDFDLTPYALVVAPMLYMIKPGVAKRFEQFVAGGGTLAVTYWTGIVDENDLCFLGGFPGPLRNLLGVWCEETDAYYPHQKNTAVFADGTSFDCGFLADILHEETAEVIAKFRDDFYAGAPAVTKNAFGCGAAWYLASRFAVADLADFYRARISEAGIIPLIPGFGAGVQVANRAGFLFVLNFSGDESWAELPACEEITTGERFQGRTVLAKNASLILRRL
jgi:beta-galactosidase